MVRSAAVASRAAWWGARACAVALAAACVAHASRSDAQACKWGVDPKTLECRTTPPLALPPPPSLELRSDPPGALVREGDAILGTTPQTIGGGHHVIRLEAAGYRAEAIEINVHRAHQPHPPVRLKRLPRLRASLRGCASLPRRDAAVEIDDGGLRLLPLGEHVLEPGEYTVRLVAPAHEPWETRVVATLDAVVPVEGCPTPRPGRLIVGEKRLPGDLVGVQVLLDGEPKGVTPLVIDRVAAGEHTLVLQAPGWRQPLALTVDPEEVRTVTVRLPEPPPVPPLRPDRIEQLRFDCERKRDDAACVALAYAYHRGAEGLLQDDEQALQLYKSKCKLQDDPAEMEPAAIQACLAVAYFVKAGLASWNDVRSVLGSRPDGLCHAWRSSSKRTRGEADRGGLAAAHLDDDPGGDATMDYGSASFDVTMEAACLYPLAHGSLDITTPGDALTFGARGEGDQSYELSLEYAALAGVGWIPELPVYGDVGLGVRYTPSVLGHVLGAFAHLSLRQRTLDQLDVASHASARVLRVGYGIDAGLLVVPDWPIYARAGGRYSGYFNDLISSWGVFGALGAPIANNLSLEGGVIGETMPTRVRTVSTFGVERKLADRVFNGVAFAQLVYLVFP